MKKEIGSIFPLSDSVLSKAESEKASYKGDRFYYSLCREALYDIAKAIDGTGNTVLIPAYTCQTVITPFKEAGWKCAYFSVRRNLRIDTEGLLQDVENIRPTMIVVHPFFGMDLNEEEVKTLDSIKGKGVLIVLDLTQCLFSTKEYMFPSFVVASYRKWMPIPDGGYLQCRLSGVKISQPVCENVEFTEKEIAAMYLRCQYFGNGEQRTKRISIQLSKAADHIAESNISVHRISQIAYNLLNEEDVENNQKSRFVNYTYLFNNILESEKVSKVCDELNKVTTAPLYFTIYVKDRPALQRLLAQNAIYAPVIWPVEDEKVLINDEVKYIYDHILAIPCDQRYNEKDMQRVVELINNY